MTQDSVITKADLLRIPTQRMEEAKNGYTGTKKFRRVLEAGKANQQWYAEKANGNLYVQDYTGVNPVIGNINSAQGVGTKIKQTKTAKKMVT